MSVGRWLRLGQCVESSCDIGRGVAQASARWLRRQTRLPARVSQVAQLGCGGGGSGCTGGSGGDGGGGGRGGGGRGGTERKFRDGRANGRQGDGWEVVSGRRRVRRTGGGDQSPTKGLREEQALSFDRPPRTYADKHRKSAASALPDHTIVVPHRPHPKLGPTHRSSAGAAAKCR